MELILCFLLATLITGGRGAVDIIHAIKGTTPPHVEKAKLKAQQQQAAPAKGSTGGRSPYAAGKPRLKDVAAVYWGDAMADVIDAHDKRRQAKKNPPTGDGAPAAKKDSLLKQAVALIVRPVGDPNPAPAVDDRPPPPGPDQNRPAPPPLWPCLGCDLMFTGPPPADQRCIPCSTEHARNSQPPTTPAAPNRGLQPEGESVDQQARDDRTATATARYEQAAADGDWNRAEAIQRGEQFKQQLDAVDDLRTLQDRNDTPIHGGSSMSHAASSAGSATGDAHDLESAIHQCDLLADDLTTIDTSLDVIDEAIASAGSATELVEAFLRSKSVDETTVAGMATAREMLSPDRIKALMDAVAAAKRGLTDTREELVRMHEHATEALKGADGSVVNGR